MVLARWILGVVAIAGLATGTASAASPDHFKCYKIKETRNRCLNDLSQSCKTDAQCNTLGPCIGSQTRTVTLQDTFEFGSFDIKKPRHLCVPADKNDEGIRDAQTHLKSYQAKASKGSPKHTRQTLPVRNQLTGSTSSDGVSILQTIKEDLLLVPSLKSLSGPVGEPTSSLDHYKCYAAKEVKNRCTGDLTSKCSSDSDCAVAGGACHRGVPNDLLVELEDQFETGLVEVKKPKTVCTPVDKNGEGVRNRRDHLTCYQIKSLNKHVKRSGIHLNNQFGPEVVATTKEDLLCVPSLVGPELPPQKPDHFKCYKTKETKSRCLGDLDAKCKTNADCPGIGPCLGFPKDVTATLEDQFESGPVDVQKPSRLCTPVDKNGEGIEDEETHLKAYDIKLPRGVKHQKHRVNVRNQFTPQNSSDDLTVVSTIKPDFLLVPTAKSLTGPASLPNSALDHYKCYRAQENKNRCINDFFTKCTSDSDCAVVGGACDTGLVKNLSVTLTDQFETGVYGVSKLTHLCNPVDKNGEGISNDVDHLTCYTIKGDHTKRQNIYVDNQFGPEVLATTKEDLLCVPSLKNPGPADPNLPDPNLPDPNLPDPNLPDPNLPDPNLPDPNLPPLPEFFLDFTPKVADGICGEARLKNGNLFQNLHCGVLFIGGSAEILREGQAPIGSTNRNGLECTGDVCNIVPWPVRTTEYECTDVGCFFGSQVPIPNAGLSTCVVNTYAEPASGFVNLATGEAQLNVVLTSEPHLTGNQARPCAVCVDNNTSDNALSGSPANPAFGVCSDGTRFGQACRTTNPDGITHDCPPDPSASQGTIPVDLSPLTTGQSLKIATETGVGNQLFCPGQGPNDEGCFGSVVDGRQVGSKDCARLELNGTTAATPIVPGVPSEVTLASVFCIPGTSSGNLNFAADLPGPGATTLFGDFTLIEAGGPTDPNLPDPNLPDPNAADPNAPELLLEFTPTLGSGTCGLVVREGALNQTLDCGVLYIGGGAEILREDQAPIGVTNRYGLRGCDDLICELTPISEQGEDFECSDTGCNFGSPVPIANAGLSSCVINTFAEPIGGTLNLLGGQATLNVNLTSAVFLTGNNARPCPVCVDNVDDSNVVVGGPGNQLSGVCSRGPNIGEPCKTTNPRGLTRDCRPDPSTSQGTIPVNLSPLRTGTSSLAHPQGFFCPGQGPPQQGCFNAGASCRSIEVTGSPAPTPIGIGSPKPVTLGSTFCIPGTSSPNINFATNLPGPGTTTLVGEFLIIEP